MKLKPKWIFSPGELWRLWCVKAAVVGAALPELLQLLADNSHLLPGFDSSTKLALHYICLAAVVLLRNIKQEAAK